MTNLIERENNRRSHVAQTQHHTMSVTASELEDQTRAGLDWKGRMFDANGKRDLSKSRNGKRQRMAMAQRDAEAQWKLMRNRQVMLNVHEASK